MLVVLLVLQCGEGLLQQILRVVVGLLLQLGDLGDVASAARAISSFS